MDEPQVQVFDISALPSETLGEILLLALDSTFWDSVQYDEAYNQCTAVLEVARIQRRIPLVSRQFYSALGPAFWRTVVIRPRPSGSLAADVTREDNLGRAGILPLRFLCHLTPEALSKADAFKMFSMLPKYLLRASLVMFYLPEASILEDRRWDGLINRISGNGIVGVTFRTYGSPPYNRIYQPTWVRKLFQLPHLQHLITTMHWSRGDIIYLDNTPASEYLTHLTVGNTALSWVLHILAAAPGLVELRMGAVFGALDESQRVTHEGLEALHITAPAEDIVSKHLILPSLKTCEIAPFDYSAGPAQRLWPDLKNNRFFETVCSSLRRLIIWHGALHVDMAHVLATLTGLEELSLRHLHVHGTECADVPVLPDNVLASLCAPSLPGLRSLSLVVVEPQLLQLCHLLQSRMDADQVAFLTFLGITVWNEGRADLKPDVEGRLEEARTYWNARISGWRHHQFLDGVLEAVEDQGAEIHLVYQGYSLIPNGKGCQDSQMLGMDQNNY